jgi:hypothetical protein
MRQYAALTYCWGDKKEAACQITTTSHSLEQHLDRIPFNNLTRVVQDTITMARALSIRYVWIDALCMVQDSMEDWATESGLMGSVYSNASVTICPISSHSCLEGFLDRASPVKVNFRSTLRPDIHGVLNLRYQHVHNALTAGKDWSHRDAFEAMSSWRNRGWTYQEELLSTRFIRFGHPRICYSCPNHMTIEASDRRKALEPGLAHTLKQHSLSRDTEHLRTVWTNMVMRYARRQLTNELD